MQSALRLNHVAVFPFTLFIGFLLIRMGYFNSQGSIQRDNLPSQINIAHKKQAFFCGFIQAFILIL